MNVRRLLIAMLIMIAVGGIAAYCLRLLLPARSPSSITSRASTLPSYPSAQQLLSNFAPRVKRRYEVARLSQYVRLASPAGSAQEDSAHKARVILSFMKAQIDPSSWEENGGAGEGVVSDSAMPELVITQTIKNHESIANLLQQLEQCKGIQVEISAKCLSCDEPATKAVIDGLVSMSSVTLAGAVGRDTAFYIASEVQAENVVSTLGSLATSTSLITTPKVTVFNNRSAILKVTTNTYYVSDVKKLNTVGGSATYTPVMSSAESGITLNVPHVAVDGAAIAIHIHPRLSNLLDLVAIPYGDPSDTVKRSIQKPVTTLAEFDADMTVPVGRYVVAVGKIVTQGAIATTRPTANDAYLVTVLGFKVLTLEEVK